MAFEQTTYEQINAHIKAGHAYMWIETQQFSDGYAAVLFWINTMHENGTPAFAEPYSIGFGRYATRKEAFTEVLDWALSEKRPYITDRE